MPVRTAPIAKPSLNEPIRDPLRQRYTFRRPGDQFYVDLSKKPPNMSYEWRRKTVFGQEDRESQVIDAENGWRPVPPSRHPETFGENAEGEYGVKSGLILCERPAAMTEDARAQDAADAEAQKMDESRRLGLSPEGTFERVRDRRITRVRRSYATEVESSPEMEDAS